MKNAYKRIVVKVGTSSLTNDRMKTDLQEFDKLAFVLSDLHNRGHEIILVTSGAIAIGTNVLGLSNLPNQMKYKQAAAAVGQSSMMFLYDKFFHDYDKKVAQILLNAQDIEQEEKKENLTNTFSTLLEMVIIPIVNENDSVSYTEIESEDRLFGDNDMLSAVVAVLCEADDLIILSDIDGFYDRDPCLYPDANLIRQIDRITDETFELAGGAGSRRGTGGMRTKLQAASLASAQTIDVRVINGKHPELLLKIVDGEDHGTLFPGVKRY